MKSVHFLVLIAALGALASTKRAFAQGNSRSNMPEIFYQPNVNNKSLELLFTQTMTADQYTTSVAGTKTADFKRTDTVYAMNAGYGLTESIAIRVGAGLASTTIEQVDVGGGTSTLKATGMTDFSGALLAVVPFSGWALNFGIEGASAPQTKKLPSTSAEGNEVTGGTTITPYVGFSYTRAGGGYWGLKSSYVSRAERAENANTPGAQDYKITGGNGSIWEAYYQMTWDSFDIDLRAGMIFQDELNYTFVGGSTGNRESISSPFATLGVQYQIASSANLRAQYGLTMIPAYVDRSVHYSSYNHGVAGLRFRFEF